MAGTRARSVWDNRRAQVYCPALRLSWAYHAGFLSVYLYTVCFYGALLLSVYLYTCILVFICIPVYLGNSWCSVYRAGHPSVQAPVGRLAIPSSLSAGLGLSRTAGSPNLMLFPWPPRPRHG